jgi:DNA-binding transcriptional LysR family regulator
VQDFDLNLLPIAVAVATTRSVTRAAQQLGMSQSAVSTALARLRGSMRDPLFVRTGRGMEPTPRAEALVSAAQEILLRVREDLLRADTFDAASSDATVAFALTDIGDMVILPRIFSALRAEAPRLKVNSVSAPPAQIESGLEAGSIDLGVGFFPDLNKRNYYQQRLYTNSFVCLLRADHPIEGRRLTLKQFLALDHAVVQAEGRSLEFFEQVLSRRRIRRNIVLRTPHITSIPFVIATSDLVVTVPLPVATSFVRLANIKMIRPPIPVPRLEIRQYWHRKFHDDARNRWLRALVARLFVTARAEWERLP